MKESAQHRAPSGTRVATGPDIFALFELVGSLLEARERLGWTQGDLALAAGLTAPRVSLIENGRTRVTEKTARSICDALDLELDETFLRLLPAATAATLFDVERHALIAAATDPSWPHVTARAIERADSKLRVYFVEGELRAQLEALPICKAESCPERALRPSGYCSAHKWKAAHERSRRAIAKPIELRSWVTEDEATRDVHRAWETVHQAIVAGELRAARVSGCVVIVKADLAHWDETLPAVAGTQRWHDEAAWIRNHYGPGRRGAWLANRLGIGETTVYRRLKPLRRLLHFRGLASLGGKRKGEDNGREAIARAHELVVQYPTLVRKAIIDMLIAEREGTRFLQDEAGHPRSAKDPTYRVARARVDRALERGYELADRPQALRFLMY